MFLFELSGSLFHHVSGCANWLVWDRTAFWLMLKRLEADRFCWPKDAAVVTLTVEQLHWLLAGIDLAAMQALLSEQQRLANQLR